MYLSCKPTSSRQNHKQTPSKILHVLFICSLSTSIYIKRVASATKYLKEQKVRVLPALAGVCGGGGGTHSLAEEGFGESQFQQGARHCGTLGTVCTVLSLRLGPYYTAKNQYRKLETNIPRKGIARPNLPNFHFHVSVAHRHVNVEIGTEASQFPENQYINRIFVAV
jgi:hypothetical protein